jgi:hypothetical protein
MNFARIPSEISFEWVYFPPFFFTVVWGFLCAYGVARLLNATGLSRFFWHPGLVFLALWVLLSSLLGLTFIPP